MHRMDGSTYSKPALQRFGTFRELTRLGWVPGTDFAVSLGIATGCNPNDNETDYGCEDGRS